MSLAPGSLPGSLLDAGGVPVRLTPDQFLDAMTHRFSEARATLTALADAEARLAPSLESADSEAAELHALVAELEAAAPSQLAAAAERLESVRRQVVADPLSVTTDLDMKIAVWLTGARRTLSRWVVLEGLLNFNPETSAAAALQERRFLAAVKPPNVAGVYNFANRGSGGCIVMEYVGGKTLREFRKERGPLPRAEAVAYVHRVLSAFAYLHR